MWLSGPALFTRALRGLKAEFDQAAGSFRARRKIRLSPAPIINFIAQIGRKPNFKASGFAIHNLDYTANTRATSNTLTRMCLYGRYVATERGVSPPRPA